MYVILFFSVKEHLGFGVKKYATLRPPSKKVLKNTHRMSPLKIWHDHRQSHITKLRKKIFEKILGKTFFHRSKHLVCILICWARLRTSSHTVNELWERLLVWASPSSFAEVTESDSIQICSCSILWCQDVWQPVLFTVLALLGKWSGSVQLSLSLSCVPPRQFGLSLWTDLRWKKEWVGLREWRCRHPDLVEVSWQGSKWLQKIQGSPSPSDQVWQQEQRKARLCLQLYSAVPVISETDKPASFLALNLLHYTSKPRQSENPKR